MPNQALHRTAFSLVLSFQPLVAGSLGLLRCLCGIVRQPVSFPNPDEVGEIN